MNRSRVVTLPALAFVAFAAPAVRAGEFDVIGAFAFAPSAVATEGFESMAPFDPDAGDGGGIAGIEPVVGDALEGATFARVRAESRRDYVHVPMSAPTERGAYRAQLWTRGGSSAAVLAVSYTTRPEGTVLADMSPTGRCTSDGWVELASGAISIDATDLARVTIAVQGQTDVDAYEIVPAGDYIELPSCQGVRDPVCGPDAVCLAGSCRQGEALVPALPDVQDRRRMVDVLEMRLRWFYGGRATRAQYLPIALAELDKMRAASTAWSYWSHFATAIHLLHDWHTQLGGLIQWIASPRRLNLCFIESNADQSVHSWPSHPQYFELLVSHVGANRNLGLHPGDRLLAVDGMHPIEWARSLVDIDWGWWQADDDSVNAEFAERMRGLIPVFARTLTLVRCDPETLSCSSVPEVIDIASLELDGPDQGDLVQCDNRPAYHLVDGPDPATHWVDGVYQGLLVDSQPGEDLYGMTWDSLWGDSYTPVFQQFNTEVKANARGVILDHRAGNGGTIDAPAAITELVRGKFPLAIFPYVRPTPGYEGPDTLEDGLSIYGKYKSHDYLTFTVGSADPDEALPVALLTHRDGSASDYLPFGMKGASKVRVFGPHATAGAFSSFAQIYFWGHMGLRLAGGDTISFEGATCIGKGAEPDEIVVPLQSDLLQGRDTLYERALAWVREESKP